MAPEMHERPLPLWSCQLREPVVAIVSVALQEAPVKARQELLGKSVAASGGISEQLRPSNKVANIAGDMRVTLSAIVGQTNLQPSRRLCTNTRHVRSQTKILIRSTRFDRHTKAAPLNGLSFGLQY